MQSNNKYLNLKILVVTYVITVFLINFIPAGTYQYDENGQVIADSYEQIEETSVEINYLSAFIDGFIGLKDPSSHSINAYNSGTMAGAIILIILILAIGSFMMVVNEIKVMDKLIIRISELNVSLAVITIFISLFFILGATTHGMYETTVAFVPLLILLYTKYGVDKIFVAKVMLYSLAVGHIGGLINPFATGIAFELAGTSLMEGFELRLLILVVLTIVTLVVLLRDLQQYEIKTVKSVGKSDKYRLIDYFNLFVFVLAYAIMILSFIPLEGTLSFSMVEISMIFILLSFLLGLINKLKLDDVITLNVDGMKAMFVIAISIGIARASYVLLYNSYTIDTIVYYITMYLAEMPLIIVIIIIALFYLLFAFFIPSTSALAVLTIPILSVSFSLLQLPQDLLVILYQSMIGVLKVFAITSPLVIALLSMLDISYQTWLRACMKYVLLIFTITMSLIMIYYI